MSLQKAEQFLQNKGFLDHVIRLEESTAIRWLEERRPLGVGAGRIAEDQCHFYRESRRLLILTEGIRPVWTIANIRIRFT